ERLRAPVLPAELDLQREHGLTVALEAEVAGLDDAGVDRPDRDLVDAGPLDAEEGVRRRVAAERFRPRVILDGDAGLDELALEALRLGQVRRERDQRRRRARERQAAVGVLGEDGEDVGPPAAERGDARAGPAALEDRRAERRRLEERHVAGGDAVARAQHQPPPSRAAAWCRTRDSAPGT